MRGLPRAVLLAAALLATASSAAISGPRAPRAAAPPDLGGLLLVGFSGTEVFGNRELEELLCVARVGGIILFARNVVDAEQVERLTRDARDASRACTGRRAGCDCSTVSSMSSARATAWHISSAAYTLSQHASPRM